VLKYPSAPQHDPGHQAKSSRKMPKCFAAPVQPAAVFIGYSQPGLLLPSALGQSLVSTSVLGWQHTATTARWSNSGSS
jgi:hypothetical protein